MSGWNPACSSASETSRLAKIMTARFNVPLTITMIALNRSATNVMPKGARQSPSCAASTPASSTSTSSHSDAPNSKMALNRPIWR